MRLLGRRGMLETAANAANLMQSMKKALGVYPKAQGRSAELLPV
eukprot:COSAG06_NODE_60579_length_270_cov_0.894737_1_plen_43_part_10